MTIEQMNEMYGTKDTDDFGQEAWLLSVNETMQMLITRPGPHYEWATCTYDNESFENETIWPTLTDAYEHYLKTKGGNK